MSGVLTEDAIKEAIKMRLEKEVASIITEEMEKIQAAVVRRVHAATDAIALKVLSYYSVERNQGNIVITVRKELSQ